MAVIVLGMDMRGILTWPPHGSTFLAMFDEADLPRRKSDLLADLAREDLDKLSIAELDERIAGLEAELVRARAKREGAAAFRAAADSLFKK
jgi:uncharacterized small protein (DUF1192 family)